MGVVLTGAAPPAQAASCVVERPDYRTATYQCDSLPPEHRVCALDRYKEYCSPWVPAGRKAVVKTEYVIIDAWADTRW